MRQFLIACKRNSSANKGIRTDVADLSVDRSQYNSVLCDTFGLNCATKKRFDVYGGQSADVMKKQTPVLEAGFVTFSTCYRFIDKFLPNFKIIFQHFLLKSDIFDRFMSAFVFVTVFRL